MVLIREFHSPVFNLPYRFIVQISSDAIPNFMKWYPLSLTLNLGIRKGIEAQTRVQTQGHFADNCNNICVRKISKMPRIILSTSELIPSFTKQYPLSLTFWVPSIWGLKKGIREAQTRVQKQGDFTDNCDNIM